MQFKIIKLSYLYFVCILKQCQYVYILNICVKTLDILQSSKIEESYFTFNINVCTQYREKDLENIGVYH